MGEVVSPHASLVPSTPKSYFEKRILSSTVPNHVFRLWVSSFGVQFAGLSTAEKKFQDKNFHKFQDTRQVVGRSHVQTRVDNGYMYGPRISKL